MKFPKIDLCCEDNLLRPVMSYVCVKKDFTFATDGHVLVRHVTSEIFKEEFVSSLPDDPIMIPSKAIFLMCQKATVKVSLTDDKKQIQLHRLDGSVITYKLRDDCRYPDTNSVIPDPKNTKPISKIGLSSTLLSRLTDGLGCDIPILHMSFFDDHSAIYVTSPHTFYEGAVGIIMPVNINM